MLLRCHENCQQFRILPSGRFGGAGNVTNRASIRLKVAAAAAVMIVLPGAAQANGAPGPNIQALGGHLLLLLAVVLVIESAMSALFQWRVYRDYFNSTALKTPIMAMTGLLLVVLTNYDPVERLLLTIPNLTLPRYAPFFTYPLSALIIAGGSAGIYALLKRLGIRSEPEPAETKDLKPFEAYLSIRFPDGSSPEPIQVSIEELDQAPADDGLAYMIDHLALPPLAGTVSSGKRRLSKAFLADRTRFPTYGGYRVRADRHYRIAATYVDPNQAPEKGPVQKGIYRGRFAPRAFIDLSVPSSWMRPS